MDAIEAILFEFEVVRFAAGTRFSIDRSRCGAE
jgi:hypothetical protein